MPRKPSISFTDKELEIMRLIWQLGEASARQIQERLPGAQHYNSVMTIIRVLERKSHLTHREDGRTYIYRATVSQTKSRKKVLSHLVKHVFDGSAASLVLNLVEAGDLTMEDLDDIRRQTVEPKRESNLMNALMQEGLAFSQNWGQTMLVWSWQSALLIGAILVAARFWPSASSKARHQLWLAGMAAVAVLPLWASVARSLPIRQPLSATVTDFVTPPITSTVSVDSFPAVQSSVPVPLSAPAATVSLTWGIVFLAWSAGFATCLINTVRFYNRLRRLRRTAIRIRTVRTARGRNVAVARSAEIRTPQVAGVLHPMILLPADMADWSTREEMRGVLLHELAHLERRDQYVGLFQALLGSVFFFHPLVRHGLRQLGVERELACDESVASAGMDGSVYAEAILKVAEHSVSVPTRYELAFDSSKKVLERRMKMILNRSERQGRGRAGGAPWARVVVMFTAITCLFLPPGELAARLQDSVKPNQPPADVSSAAPAQTLPVTTAAAVPVVVRTAQAPVQQPASASLSGRVYDQRKAQIPGVLVKLTSDRTSATVITNETGLFMFPSVSPGTYDLTTSLPGFLTETIKLQVAGLSQSQDIVLRLAGPGPQAAAPAPVPAQQSVAVSLSGRVHDQTMARIPGVSVSLTSGQTKLAVITNETGTFVFPEVQPGVYDLVVSLPGFRTQRINLRVERPSQQQDVTLQLSSINTVVEVTAQRAQPQPPPPIPAPPPPPLPVRIGGDVAQANLIYQPKPVYPASMRSAGIQGPVTIQAVIGTDGAIVAPRVISLDVHPDLAAAALESVKQWRYRPSLLNGVPVEVVTTVVVNFNLMD